MDIVDYDIDMDIHERGWFFNSYIYCKTLIFSEPFNLAKLAIEIKTLKIKAAKIKP